MFRLVEDLAVINRYGFNSGGMRAVETNLNHYQKHRLHYRSGLVGVNAGKNKQTSEENASDDFIQVFRRWNISKISQNHPIIFF